MKELMMKARSGVTLVELLVVILIVTILSVSMLPLLQPFVIESQYAAEPIPVLGNLRTKIGLYNYDKNHLPYTNDFTLVETWKRDTADTEKFVPAVVAISATDMNSVQDCTASKSEHLQEQAQINYEELKGKRSRPTDYMYYVLDEEKNTSYALGCFGGGDGGLKIGCGYAICEINFTTAGKKYIGTWKQYKPGVDSQIKFYSVMASCTKDNQGRYTYCYMPDYNTFQAAIQAEGSGSGSTPQIITDMKNCGWEF